MFCPWGSSSENGICVDDELPGAGDERELGWFAGCDEAPIEGDELVVMKEGCRDGSSVDAASETVTSARDVPFSLSLAAVMNEGGEAGEACRLLPGYVAELGKADEHGEGRAFTDAVDREQEVMALGEIVMRGDHDQEFGQKPGPALGEALDVDLDEAALIGAVGVLATDLAARDVLLGLLDESEEIGHRNQPRVGIPTYDLTVGDTVSDQPAIDPVALGAAENCLSVTTDLERLSRTTARPALRKAMTTSRS